MKQVVRILIGVSALAMASVSFANNANSNSQSNSDSSGSGFYAGILAGGGHASESGEYLTPSTSGSSFAFGADAGYQWAPNWGAEFGFTYLPIDGGSTASNVNLPKDIYLFDLAVRPTVNINDGFYLYGKAGIALQHRVSSSIGGSDASNTAAFYIGGGIGYHLTEQLQVVGDVASSISGDLDTLSYMGGVSYSF